MIEYRVAEPTEFHLLLEIFKDVHNKSGYSFLEFSVSEIIDNLTHAFLNPSLARVFIAVENDKIIGVCYAAMRILITSKDLIAQETGLWVANEYQGKDVAKVLIEDFKEWGKENGAKVNMCNSSLGIDNERAKAFFEKNGFEFCGYDLWERL